MGLEILDFIQRFRHPVLDVFFKYLTILGNHGEIWIAIILFLYLCRKEKRIAKFAFFSLLFEAVLISIIKNIIQRPRPFISNPVVSLILNNPSGYSFPSGHAASAFAVATFLYLRNIRYKNIIISIAFSMAFSRLYVYVHYLSDVLVGSLIGILVGIFMNYLYEREVIK